MSANSSSPPPAIGLNDDMNVDNETVCAPLWAIATQPAYLSVTLPALVTPAICIVLIACFFVRFYGKGCFHPNAKVLLFCQLIYTSMYCSVFLYTHGYQLLYNTLYYHNDVCALIHYAGECMVPYYAITMSVTGMVATQVGIGIERICATIYVRYYERSRICLGLGPALAGLAVLLSVAVSLFVLSDVNYKEVRLTCMGVPATAGDKSRLLYYVIIGCDLITTGLFLYSLRLNAKLGEGEGAYVLGIIYHRKENANLIRMLLPNVIAHCFVYCSFSAAAAFIRSNSSLFSTLTYNCIAVAINLVPHYTVVELTVLHIVLSRVSSRAQEFIQQVNQHKRSDEKDLYFAGYQKSWN